MQYVFGNYALDTERYELRRAGTRVKLQPKVFEVLTYLIEHRERLVSKQELLEQLWPQQFVGETTLSSCIRAVRRAVGDTGQAQRVIQTLHGRGFRFVAELEGDRQERRESIMPTILYATLDKTFFFELLELVEGASITETAWNV
jgi:DNA-binding winged helix-turn-helix (wHTH) protein